MKRNLIAGVYSPFVARSVAGMLINRSQPVFDMENGSGGGAPGAGNVPPNPNGNNGNQGNNNSGFNFDADNIWSEPASNNQSNSNQRQQPASPPNGQASDQMANFNQYVNGLNFGKMFDGQAFQQAIQTGDYNSINEAMTKSMQGVYRQAVMDVTKMLDSTVNTAVEKAVGQSKNFFQTENYRKELQQAIPIANNPNVAPVAEAIYGQMIKKHNGDSKKAVEATKQFFGALTSQSHEKFGFDKPPAGMPSSRRGGGNVSFGDDGQEFDWAGWAQSV